MRSVIFFLGYFSFARCPIPRGRNRHSTATLRSVSTVSSEGCLSEEENTEEAAYSGMTPSLRSTLESNPDILKNLDNFSSDSVSNTSRRLQQVRSRVSGTLSQT